MISRTIFVVEDDRKIASVLRDYLQAAGHSPRLFATGTGVIDAVLADRPAAIILDLMLPGSDGIQICRDLRQFSDVPVLMLTARVEESDRVAGLVSGADDYVCKPFSSAEVAARITALIRRSEGHVTSDGVSRRPFALDYSAQRAAWKGHWLPLSPAEFRIVRAMMAQPGRIFSRDQLLDHLGERSEKSSDRAIDSHLKNIRKKFTAVDPSSAPFVSVYGTGYRFDPPSPASSKQR